MISATFRARILAALLVAAVAVPVAPVLAQTTALVKGKVTDAEGKPVDKAKVTVDFQGGISNKRELTTNKKGEFIQVGLPPGPYIISAEKDGVGVSQEEIMLRLGDAPELVLALRPAAATASAADQKFRALFNEAVAAATADKHDDAIAKFTEAAGMRDDCYACYMNIGNAYYEKKDNAKAEEAFKKAIELNPNESKPYQALADLYNVMGRRDEAVAMATKAGGLGGATGASAQDLYNQGVILWNAGKMAEAKAQFEASIKADPNYPDAQFRAGMATLNVTGDVNAALPYFENYLKLAPTGEFAEQAKGVVASVKK